MMEFTWNTHAAASLVARKSALLLMWLQWEDSVGPGAFGGVLSRALTRFSNGREEEKGKKGKVLAKLDQAVQPDASTPATSSRVT